MGYSGAELRRGMDVYTADNVYLGVLRAVLPGPVALLPVESDPPAEPRSFDGEPLGPMPTQGIGNRGPRTQAPGNRYAIIPREEPALGLGAIVVAHWWGLRGRRTIPMDDILTVSLERVVVRTREESS